MCNTLKGVVAVGLFRESIEKEKLRALKAKGYQNWTDEEYEQVHAAWAKRARLRDHIRVLILFVAVIVALLTWLFVR